METALDRAHREMTDAPGDAAARLAFYGRLAEGELFVLLSEDTRGAEIVPEVFALAEGPVVLAFDREDRLTGFAARPAPYAALSGRALAARLAERGLGLGLNLGAPSGIVLPAEAVGWLAETLRAMPAEVEERIAGLRAPGGLPETLVSALGAKLGAAGGLAACAWLAGVTYAGGRRGHVLAFPDALPGAEPALARAVAEALVFSGLEAGEIDVAFPAVTDPLVARLEGVGLRFDLPGPEAPARPAPAAPGSDPARPPRLR